MTRLVLACAVMLASLFGVAAQADAAGFKRYNGGAYHHDVRKHKFHKHKVYKAHKRLRALQRYRQRVVIKRHRHDKPYRYVRRYR